jgi:hypothetical protein
MQVPDELEDLDGAPILQPDLQNRRIVELAVQSAPVTAKERDRMGVVREHVFEIERERAVRELRDPGQEREDSGVPCVRAGQPPAAREVPDRVLRDRVSNRVDVALPKRDEEVPDPGCVRVLAQVGLLRRVWARILQRHATR